MDGEQLLDYEKDEEKVLAAGPDGRRLDSTKQAGGGHPGHLEGGAETMAILNSQLAAGVRRLNEETDRVAKLREELERELEQSRKPWLVQYRESRAAR